MTELKIMYILEIWMNKYCLWQDFKPSQSTILSNIYKNLNILFPRLQCYYIEIRKHWNGFLSHCSRAVIEDKLSEVSTVPVVVEILWWQRVGWTQVPLTKSWMTTMKIVWLTQSLDWQPGILEPFTNILASISSQFSTSVMAYNTNYSLRTTKYWRQWSRKGHHFWG